MREYDCVDSDEGLRDVVARKKALEKRLVRFRVIHSFTAVRGTWGPKVRKPAPCLCSHALKPMLR